MTHTTATAAFETFVARAEADPALAGLILYGSRAYPGMPTAHSDHDVIAVLRDGVPSPLTELHGLRTPRLDVVVMTLAEFRRRGTAQDPDDWARYTYVRARLLADRLGGELGEILDRKRTLAPDEARAALDRYLDAYANQLYRSLKNHRDGRPGAGHLDAAASVPFALQVLFALHGRVTPYAKYLAWELESEPLSERAWHADRLLPVLERVLADGDPAMQRSLFGGIERAARRAGHAAVLDAWGADLELMRGTPATG
ncbi:hypothetical protein [Streptomyces sp. SBT349]|uniref:nucleotidyltransferase domain-containing protein n=1 Tax=Streptomyces sp. SBT349 TaxID=1580539 RepID=UPI00066E5E48|nr:hypothetical protein [Streptomyces sp. SBT349]